MQTTQISFEIPTQLLNTLNQTRGELTSQMRLWTAVQLFKSHKLTFGQASELAGLSRDPFLSELDHYEIPLIDYSPEDLDMELQRFEA